MVRKGIEVAIRMQARPRCLTNSVCPPRELLLISTDLVSRRIDAI